MPITAVNWRFRTGDRVRGQCSIPSGDRPGRRSRSRRESSSRRRVPLGAPHRVGFTTAQKRPLSTSLNWTSGGLLRRGPRQSGTWHWCGTRRRLYTVEFTGERNVGRCRAAIHADTCRHAAADQRLAGSVDRELRPVRHRQRLRRHELAAALDVSARGGLFVVYNHNVRSLLDRWQLDSNQLLVKLQYAWRR